MLRALQLGWKTAHQQISLQIQKTGLMSLEDRRSLSYIISSVLGTSNGDRAWDKIRLRDANWRRVCRNIEMFQSCTKRTTRTMGAYDVQRKKTSNGLLGP